MFSFRKNSDYDCNYIYTFASKVQILNDPQKYIDMQIIGWEYDFSLGERCLNYDIVTLKIHKNLYFNSIMRTNLTSSSYESN